MLQAHLEIEQNKETKEQNKQQDKVKTVLIEDCRLTRTGLKFTLNRYTCAKVIAEAGSINEGIKLIKKLKPQVVLLNFDFHSKDKNGLNNIQKAIEEVVLKDGIEPKVVILTSSKEQQNVLDALQAGVRAYCIREDIETSTLSMIINNAAQGACWIDPKVMNNTMKSFQKLAELFPKLPPVKLTQRELEVLKYIVAGKSNPEIAHELIVSVHTAKAHVTNILQKMEVKDRVQAAVKAIRLNLI